MHFAIRATRHELGGFWLKVAKKKILSSLTVYLTRAMLTRSLRWPSAVEDAIKAVQVASKVMFLLYCIGVSAVGLALVGTLIGLFASGKFTIAVNFMTSMVRYSILALYHCQSLSLIFH